MSTWTERKLTPAEIDGLSLENCLEYMQKRGQSVTLNYGEDTGLWECSWISSGERFTHYSKIMRVAARLVLRKALGYGEPMPRHSWLYGVNNVHCVLCGVSRSQQADESPCPNGLIES